MNNMSCQSINSRCHVSAPSPTLSPTDPVPRGLLTLCPAPTDPVGLDSPPPPHPPRSRSLARPRARALVLWRSFSRFLSVAGSLTLAALCTRLRTPYRTQHTAHSCPSCITCCAGPNSLTQSLTHADYVHPPRYPRISLHICLLGHTQTVSKGPHNRPRRSLYKP